MPPSTTAKTIQIAVGCACALGLLWLAYLSMSPGQELTFPVIAGIIVVIAMLLGKLDALTDLVDSWRSDK